MRSTRMLTILLDSSLDEMLWKKYINEIEALVLQASCDYAAMCRDDRYRVRITSAEFRE